MDSTVVTESWADLLYDGHDHEHGEGGLMYLPGAFGTHLSMPGYLTANVAYNSYGLIVGFDLDLDPYEDELPREMHSHASQHDGWSEQISIFMPSDLAILGDPAYGDEDDEDDEYNENIEIIWPAKAGLVRVAVLSEGGIRKQLRAIWEPVN